MSVVVVDGSVTKTPLVQVDVTDVGTNDSRGRRRETGTGVLVDSRQATDENDFYSVCSGVDRVSPVVPVRYVGRVSVVGCTYVLVLYGARVYVGTFLCTCDGDRTTDVEWRGPLVFGTCGRRVWGGWTSTGLVGAVRVTVSAGATVGNVGVTSGGPTVVTLVFCVYDRKDDVADVTSADRFTVGWTSQSTGHSRTTSVHTLVTRLDFRRSDRSLYIGITNKI